MVIKKRGYYFDSIELRVTIVNLIFSSQIKKNTDTVYIIII